MSADQTSPLVSLRDVRFAYGERQVLRGIDLSVHRGQVVAIMGGSGCGKTTLLRLIGGQLRASGGATSSIFVPGPLLRAMTEGRPVILDEINAMPPEFLKRLNIILQLRPGDTFTIQRCTDFFGAESVQHKRQHTRFFRRGADQP